MTEKCKHEKLHYQGCGDWYCVACLEYFDQEDANNIMHTNDHRKIETLQARIAELEAIISDTQTEAQAIEYLRRLPEDSRMAVFAEFCTKCGSSHPGCDQCWNDE